MLTLTITDMPEPLLRLTVPPEKLHIIGDGLEELLKRPRIAIIGTRKLTPYGRGVTQDIASQLASKGVVIISGLALGADSCAHQACLDAGGQTIAVIASGLDNIYPSTNTNLARNIIEKGGAIITEYDQGHKPFPHEFLERNRIVAALSDGVLVTEAAARSGTLNTASHALEMGIPVFAVPGNITSPLSEGCNNLIKAGAIPVTSVEDIFNALKWKDSAAKAKKVQGSTPEEQLIIDLLKTGISDGAELLSRSKLEASIFNQHLTMLEITGLIRPTGANHWSL